MAFGSIGLGYTKIIRWIKRHIKSRTDDDWDEYVKTSSREHQDKIITRDFIFALMIIIGSILVLIGTIYE